MIYSLKKLLFKSDALKLIGSQYISKILGFFVFYLLLKHLTLDTFGQVSFYLKLSDLLFLIFTAGITVKALEHRSEIHINLMHKINNIILNYYLYFFFITIVIFLLLPNSETTLMFIVLLTFLPRFINEQYTTISKRLNNHNNTAYFTIIYPAIRLLSLLFFFYILEKFNVSISFYFAVIILVMYFALAPFKQNLQIPINQESMDLKSVISILYFSSGYYYLYAIIHFLFFSTDIYYLKYFSGNISVAYYSFALGILSFFLLLITSIYKTKYLNIIFRSLDSGKINTLKINNFYWRQTIYLLVIGVVIFIACMFFLPTLIKFLFNDKYDEAINLTLLFLVNLPIIYLLTHYGAYLSKKQNIYRKTKIVFFALIANIILNLVLIPMYNELGAVISTTICNMLLTVIFFIQSRKFINGLSDSKN